MKCTFENCDKDAKAKGMCLKHYCFYAQRQRLGIPFDWPFGKKYNKRIVKHKEKEICKVGNCDKISHKKGYCSFHYNRLRHGVSLNRPKGLKGELNHNWKGGIADYPNQNEMKKNRKIKIALENGKCETCNRKGVRVHHIDGSKTNHALDNLKLLCTKCHGRVHRGRKAKTSIWIRRYGFNAKDLGKILRCSYITLRKWYKNGDIEYFLGK